MYGRGLLCHFECVWCIWTTECCFEVPSFCSDTPSEWSAPASVPGPEPPWHVLNENKRKVIALNMNMSISNLTHLFHFLLLRINPMFKMWSHTPERHWLELLYEDQIECDDLWTSSTRYQGCAAWRWHCILLAKITNITQQSTRTFATIFPS